MLKCGKFFDCASAFLEHRTNKVLVIVSEYKGGSLCGGGLGGTRGGAFSVSAEWEIAGYLKEFC